MKYAQFLFAVIPALNLISLKSLNAQTLTAELCSARLPTERALMASLYDGYDTIYLFGGHNHDHDFNETLKYSISQDSIEIAGQMPVNGYRGGAVMNKFRNIFYLSGSGGGKDIYQYFPESQSFTKVSELEEDIWAFATILQDNDTALLFGGANTNTSISLNLNTLVSENITDLPETTHYPGAVWLDSKEMAYILDKKNIFKYYPSRKRFESLGRGLPFDFDVKGIWDGRHIYVVGTKSGTYGVFQIDPDTDAIRGIPLENDPQVSISSVIYVEKLNRIYIFGGFAPGSIYEDTIYYISLDPMSPPTTTESPTTTTEGTSLPTMDPDIFNCMGRPDAVYPYPGDCAKFVICREGHGYLFSCPEPLLFHPNNRQCTWPDWVECDEEAVPTNI